MVGQLEADGRFVLLELTRSDFYVEVVALVRYFEDFRPSEAVDAQSMGTDR